MATTGHAGGVRAGDRAGDREQVLAVHDVDRALADEIADDRREPPREPLVLDVVADERDRRRRAAELVDVEAVEGVRDDAEAGRRAGPRPQRR